MVPVKSVSLPLNGNSKEWTTLMKESRVILAGILRPHTVLSLAFPLVNIGNIGDDTSKSKEKKMAKCLTV